MSWGDAFKAAYDAASAVARAVADKTMSSAREAGAAVVRTAKAAAEATERACKEMSDAAKDTAKAAADRAAKAAKTAADAAERAGKAAVDAVASAASQAAKGIAAAASGAGAVLGEVVNTAVGLVVTLAVSAYTAIKAAFSDKPAQHTMTQGCPGTVVDVYNNDYRHTLIDSTFDGANDPRLAAAMTELRKPMTPADLPKQLQTIADVRKRPVDEVREEYDEYVRQRLAVDERITVRHLEPIDELKDDQVGFMGSVWQLRYGKVVGDQLGIDPVFGSLLNPTGGLVGPGNKGVAPDAWYMPESVAYHGAYHDAMGYLYNYHNEGPGYNYMHSPIGLGTANPLAGQATGIMQWAIDLAQ